MNKKIAIGLLILAGGTQVARTQWAEDALRFSTFNQGIGARSQAMGNVGVGFADDYSALFYNPAGLALQRSFEFSVGMTRTGYQNTASFLGSETADDVNEFGLNNLGLVYPLPTTRGSLTLGFGFGRVANYSSVASFSGFNASSSIVQSMTPGTNLHSQSASYVKSVLDNNIPFQLFLSDTVNGYLRPNVTDSVNQNVYVKEGGGINSWSVGAGIDVGRELSVGVSMNFLSGGYSYDRQYTESDSRGVYHYAAPYDFDRFTYTSTVNSDLSGFNMLFGLMFHKQGRLKIGASVRTPTHFDIEETFSDAGVSRFDNGDTYNVSFSDRTKYKVTTPFVFSGGFSVQFTDWLVVAGDAEYTDWREMEFNTDNPDLADENRVIRSIYQATTNLHGGAEVTLWELGLKLRGGVLWNPSPYKADANKPDFNQLGFTAGIAFMIDEQTSLNIGGALGQWKTFRDNYSIPTLPNASTTSERITSSTVNATLSFRF